MQRLLANPQIHTTTSAKYSYSIVRISGGNTGLSYVVAYGKDEGIYVELAGNTPLGSMGDIFNYPSNTFLIYGIEQNTQNKTQNPCNDEFLWEPYTIEVEKWDFIIPLYRNYTYSDHTRFLYPKEYIDDYDVRHGDYKEHQKIEYDFDYNKSRKVFQSTFDENNSYCSIGRILCAMQRGKIKGAVSAELGEQEGWFKVINVESEDYQKYAICMANRYFIDKIINLETGEDVNIE